MLAVLRIRTSGVEVVESAFSALADAIGVGVEVNVRDSSIQSLVVVEGDDVSDVIMGMERLPRTIISVLGDRASALMAGAMLDIAIGPEDAKGYPYISMLISTELMSSLSEIGIDVMVTVYGLTSD